MKKLLLLLIAPFIMGSAMAQSAKKILDNTADTFRKSSGTVVSFTATQQGARHAVKPITGIITLRNNSFALDSDALKAWFDGTTLWTALEGSGEVNVSNPTSEEIQAINPMHFITLYEKGYDLATKTTKHQGRIAHEVSMKAKKADAGVQEMVIIIDKSLNTPMQIKVRKGVTWMTIDINSYRANQNTPTSAFVFDAKAHPDYEIIDLR